MDFSTKGMTLEERYDLLNRVDLIPIYTECFKAGDYTSLTSTEITVTKDNQRSISLFWNDLYFLNKDDADKVTNQAHSEYHSWLGFYMDSDYNFGG